MQVTEEYIKTLKAEYEQLTMQMNQVEAGFGTCKYKLWYNQNNNQNVNLPEYEYENYNNDGEYQLDNELKEYEQEDELYNIEESDNDSFSTLFNKVHDIIDK